MTPELKIFVGIAGGALGIFALVLIISFICYRLTFYTDRKNHHALYKGLSDEQIKDNPHKQMSRRLVDSLAALPYEEVFIKSRDGLTLAAKYYHAKDGAPLQIQVHGYKSNSMRDFSGGATEAIRRGHNLLLIDQRAHGKSEGKTISFGVKERYDILSWIEYGLLRFGQDTKIILCGISMGAATVIMASELSLPENVVGIVADCPCLSAGAIIRKVVKEDMHLPAGILMPFVWLGGFIFGGFDMNSADCATAAKKSKIPILLIHGEGDSFVPVSMSDEIAAASELVRYEKFPEAGHGLSFIFDNARYLSVLDEFINKTLQSEDRN